ncbi:probable acyl-activating enzyme 1, peroxisomal [Olea europaea subsp. europaea]|uniref:Probable acyl-activating enzyme 1, peroxisomal n=1 Tax=Olea europaea subsp. europaea TaxID=158383 RepID=A0A8S0QZ84_OLEEU|nr:probable acyl-activating enzyme 1, peroxisomal [Olea europaea subsp. europaea]
MTKFPLTSETPDYIDQYFISNDGELRAQVASLTANIPAMQELHFGVPTAGAVLCTLNTRHASAMISVLLQHSDAKIIFVDYQLLHIAQGALDILAGKNMKSPILVLISEFDNLSPANATSERF